MLGAANDTADPNRDGFGGATLNGHNVLLFCDTETRSTFVSNSIAYVIDT